MTRAFTFSDSSASKEDENYRIFSLLENAEEEKERQIASILSWEIDIIYKILLDSDLGSSLPLSGLILACGLTIKVDIILAALPK